MPRIRGLQVRPSAPSRRLRDIFATGTVPSDFLPSPTLKVPDPTAHIFSPPRWKEQAFPSRPSSSLPPLPPPNARDPLGVGGPDPFAAHVSRSVLGSAQRLCEHRSRQSNLDATRILHMSREASPVTMMMALPLGMTRGRFSSARSFAATCSRRPRTTPSPSLRRVLCPVRQRRRCTLHKVGTRRDIWRRSSQCARSRAGVSCKQRRPQVVVGLRGLLRTSF